MKPNFSSHAEVSKVKQDRKQIRVLLCQAAA